MAKPKPKVEQPALFVDGELPPVAGAVEQQAFDDYNQIAPGVGWPQATKLSPTRIKGLKKAVLEAGGLVEWRAMLERASRSSFLTVKWRPTLEFFFQPRQILKVQEGGHDDKAMTGPNSVESTTPGPILDPWQRWIPGYRRAGFWPSHLGPRPEDPGCRATPSLLMNWRRENNVSVTVAPAETEETRLTSSIVSLRKYGKWDRANAAEERLAALQKRPPVLVPAGDVAGLGMPQRAEKPPQRPHSMAGHNRPPGPITDLEPPDWEMEMEGDPEQAEA